MARYNQHCLGILLISPFGVFIIIVFISIWFINYYQDQIVILWGLIDEVDEIISELTEDEGVSIIVLPPHWRL